MIVLNSIDPVAFRLFGLEVRWYALCILFGVALAVYFGIKEGKKLGIFSDFVLTGICIILPIAIIGARLWYVLFNLKDFNSLADVLGLNGGGLSGLAIQGGVIASLIAVYVYCRKRNVPLYKALDIVAPGFLIGQICGRWGNFFNGELYGPAVENVDLFLKLLPGFITNNMIFKGVYHHPTFLYESLLNLVGLIIILVSRRKSKKLQSGDLMGIYLIWYGIVRIFTEILRGKSGVDERLMLGPIPVSIAVSILFIVSGIAFLILKRFKGPKNNYQEIIRLTKENHVNTLIFDLDGTILDSRDLIIQSFNHVFTKYFPDYIVRDEEMESFFGPTLQTTFSKYATKDITVDELIQSYREFNLEHHDEMVKAFPGTKEMFRSLSKKGYNIAVVSSKRKDLVERGLKVTGLKEYVSIVLGEDDVHTAKPDPEGILKALEHFTNTNKAVYVGDHPNDIMAGKNAGIYTCGVLYSTKVDELYECEPDFMIRKMSDMFRIVVE